MLNANKVRVETPLRHLFDRTEYNVYDDQVINLSVGAPGPDLLKNCCKIFEEATVHRMNEELHNNSMLFQYGAAAGGYEQRVEITKFLSRAYNSQVLSEDVIITTGATQGLHLILSTLLDMKGVIFVDDVTYMIALEVFRQFTNMKLVAVKLNENGVDVDDLEKRIRENFFKSGDKLFWGMYYTIPTYHNPTGILFEAEICQKLIKMSRKYDILITCDDVYNLLYYSNGGSPKRLFAYDNINDQDYKGNVISNGSFSKIVAPGLRLGWMECPPRCAVALKDSGILKSGGATNNYTSGIMTSLVKLGLAKSHIEFMSNHYKERMLASCDILEKKLPKTCHFTTPQGGYFLWIRLPENIDGDSFNNYCLKKYKIFGISGSRFSLENKFQNYIRLSIAFQPKKVLVKAMEDFCKAIEEYCSTN